MIFRMTFAFIFAVTSSFAHSTEVKKQGKIPITAKEFHRYVVKAFNSNKGTNSWLESLPTNFSKADKERWNADFNRLPKGPEVSEKDGVIVLKARDSAPIKLRLYEFGPERIVFFINDKKITLDPRSNYPQLRKQLLQELQAVQSAGFSWGIFPEAHAEVVTLGAAAILAAMLYVAWLGWGAVNHLWGCLRSVIGNRRLAPGQIMKHLEKTGKLFQCIHQRHGEDSIDLINKLKKHFSKQRPPEDLPQIGSAQEQRFLLEDNGIVVAKALSESQTPGRPGKSKGDGGTARLWKMFEPSAKLFSMNLQKKQSVE